MPPTRHECLRVGKKQEEQDHAIALSLLDTAAIKAVELTGHPGWDRFLEQCQAMLNKSEKDLASWMDNLANAYSTDDLRLAQRNVERAKAQAEILKTIMNLPGEILKERHAAQSR